MVYGNDINDLMNSKRSENSAYKTSLLAYEVSKQNWDKYLMFETSFASVYDWSAINMFIPPGTGPYLFVKPARPDRPWRPEIYSGPTWTGTTPFNGYGAKY